MQVKTFKKLLENFISAYIHHLISLHSYVFNEDHVTMLTDQRKLAQMILKSLKFQYSEEMLEM